MDKEPSEGIARYEDFRATTFPIATPLLANIPKGKSGGPQNFMWGGNGVFWDVVLTRPVGMSASQTGHFPPGAEAVERQANVGIKRTYVQRQIDALAIQGTKDKKAAYIPLARKIATEALDAARLGQQEVLHGDGRGVKGLITVVTSTTVVDVGSPYGLSGAGQGGLLLDQGMFIAVLDTSASDAVLGTATVNSAVNAGDTVTLTLDTAITGMAVGDKIVAASTATSNSFNNYPNGLLNMLNFGGSFASIHNIDQASFARWDTTRLVAGTDTGDASQPDEFDVWELAQRIAGLSGKDAQLKPKQFLLQTTPGIHKRLAQSFLGQRRLTPEDFQNIRGGYKALTVFGLPMLKDFWNPAGVVYLVHLPSVAWVDRQDWVRLSFEGSGPWRFISGRDAYEINFGSYWNTAVVNRISHGLISGYTDTVRYSHVK